MNSKNCQKIKWTFFQSNMCKSLLLVWSGMLLIFTLVPVHAEPTLGVPIPAPTLRPSEEQLEKASELYAQRCANCHGTRGDGRGVMSSKLSPPPRNLRSYSWFKTTTPKHLKRVILGGGSAIGKSLLMPANPDLRNKPKLVSALIYYLEQLVDRPKK